jgi:hypothetical protein
MSGGGIAICRGHGMLVGGLTQYDGVRLEGSQSDQRFKICQ